MLRVRRSLGQPQPNAPVVDWRGPLAAGAFLVGAYFFLKAPETPQDKRGKRVSRMSEKDLSFAGYSFTAGPEGTKIHRDVIDTKKSGDYGADPLGDGRFRMVPSGDIVDWDERNRRLKR